MEDIQRNRFPDEINHLEELNGKLENALDQAEESVWKLDQEYREAQCYMMENRGEIDPHEMFQNEQLLKQTDRTGAHAAESRDRLAKLKESPYFARIDFKEDGEQEAEVYYIGRFGFRFERNPLIFDWRAPVSGMFYDCEIGKAGFAAPSGTIGGMLTRKRQFKIKNGLLEYVLESSSHVQDEVLQRELSHTSDEKMKSIIATIQKEQNQIIRNGSGETMIIQGAAGSGKTSIALHRIAYLLYRDKHKLKASNVTILSPNQVFGDYISNVIPELGEEPVYELSIRELAQIQLEKVLSFEPDPDPFERTDRAWKERVQFKSTLEFVSLMDEYIKQMPDMVFVPSPYTFGPFSVTGEWIESRYHAYGSYPVKQRLSMIADDIGDRFDTDNIREEDLPGKPLILKSLNSMLKYKSTLDIYKEFYEKIGHGDFFNMPDKKTVEWADVYPFLYLHGAYEGVKQSGITRHLVIDEMQDYTPIQYAALNRLFPCQKTILGDYGQTVNPNYLNTLDDLRKIYEKAEFVRLNKSYRSTYEIISFARLIKNGPDIEPVKRHGEKPAVIACPNEREELRQIKDSICSFKAGEGASFGIILKTNDDARAIHEILSQEYEVALITPESSGFHNGITITSIQMAKGLEFDQVLIPQVNGKKYGSDHDRSLLYIACTRAMHKLTLTYTGTCSPYMPESYIAQTDITKTLV